MGLSVCVVLAMFIVAVRLHWELRERLWFWPVIVALLLCHVPLVFFLRWPQGRTPTMIYTLPLGIVDFGVVFGILELADTVFSRD